MHAGNRPWHRRFEREQEMGAGVVPVMGAFSDESNSFVVVTNYMGFGGWPENGVDD